MAPHINLEQNLLDPSKKFHCNIWKKTFQERSMLPWDLAKSYIMAHDVFEFDTPGVHATMCLEKKASGESCLYRWTSIWKKHICALPWHWYHTFKTNLLTFDHLVYTKIATSLCILYLPTLLNWFNFSILNRLRMTWCVLSIPDYCSYYFLAALVIL